MRKAAIDIGTNSVRLAMANVNGERLNDLQEDIRITRLGAAKQCDGSLVGFEVDDTLNACQYFLNQAVAWSAEETVITATAALRDALNRNELQNYFEAKLNHPLYIVSAEEEAALGHLGATFSQMSNAMVLDIGGGSTECTWMVQGQLKLGHMPIGALRLKLDVTLYDQLPMHLTNLLPPAKTSVGPLIGTGGTITTLAAMLQELEVYDDAKVNKYTLNRQRLRDLRQKIFKLSLSELKKLPGLPTARADTILYGLDILLAVLDALDVTTLQVSTRDGLHGRLLTPFQVITHSER